MKAAVTAPVIPDWLSEFLEADDAPNDTLDPANPYWDFGTDSGQDFGFTDYGSAPSLDL